MISQVCHVVSIYLHKYILSYTLHADKLPRPPLFCGLISIVSHVFRSLYREPDFSDLENRLVVGANFLFRTLRANQMVRNLANGYISQSVSAIFHRSTGLDSRPSQTTGRAKNHDAVFGDAIACKLDKI